MNKAKHPLSEQWDGIHGDLSGKQGYEWAHGCISHACAMADVLNKLHADRQYFAAVLDKVIGGLDTLAEEGVVKNGSYRYVIEAARRAKANA